MKFFYTALFAAMLANMPHQASAQCTTGTNIVTVAGNHTNGYSGDGGESTAAQIGSPFAVAADAAGNFYIADYFNNAVRKVDGSGTITTIAGDGTPGFAGDGGLAISSRLNGPAGVTLDASGNIYIADKFNERIRKIDAVTGVITTIAGNGYHGGWNNAPFGNDGPATAASLTYPVSVAFDCSGNMFIADWGSQTVRKVDNSGTITRFAGTHKGDYNGDAIMATAAHLNAPTGLAADCAGNVYIADTWNNRVRKVNSAGIITTYAGNGAAAYSGDGSPAGSASIWGPWGITQDACGNVYICDYDNYVVRKVDGAGYISTFAGINSRGYTGDGGPAAEAELNIPSSLAIGADNNIYIADYGNMVVRLVGTAGFESRAFVNGTTQSIHVCKDAQEISMAAMMSTEHLAGRNETWTIAAMPLHGSLTAPTGTITEGSIVTPSGLLFTPEKGFEGRDEFTVLMNDGTTSASTTISIFVDKDQPNAGVITQSAAASHGVTLTSSGDAGGKWSSSDSRILTVDAAGNVNNLTNGVATVYYTVTNACGSTTTSAKVASQVSEIPSNVGVVFPNPNKGSFRYDFISDNDKAMTITATDVTGRVIYKEPVQAVAGINTYNIELPNTIQRPSVIWLSIGDGKTNIKPTAVTLSE